MRSLKNKVAWLMIATFLMSGFQHIVFAGDWLCNSVDFYYDVNKNKVLDGADKRITEEVKKLIREGKQYFPLNTFIVASNNYCKKWLNLHWCSNTAYWNDYVNGIDYLTIYKGGKIVPKLVEELRYETSLNTIEDLYKLKEIYKQSLYTDITYMQNYDDELNPFDYAPSTVFISVPEEISQEDFEETIMRTNIENLMDYINTHYNEDEIQCSVTYPTTASAKITCWKKKLTHQQQQVFNNETNTTENVTVTVVNTIEDTMYLNFEEVFLRLNEEGLARIKTVETFTFTAVGGTPVKIAENVKTFYIDEPVRYSFIHTPQRILTCHVDPHGVVVCL